MFRILDPRMLLQNYFVYFLICFKISLCFLSVFITCVFSVAVPKTAHVLPWLYFQPLRRPYYGQIVRIKSHHLASNGPSSSCFLRPQTAQPTPCPSPPPSGRPRVYRPAPPPPKPTSPRRGGAFQNPRRLRRPVGRTAMWVLRSLLRAASPSLRRRCALPPFPSLPSTCPSSAGSSPFPLISDACVCFRGGAAPGALPQAVSRSSGPRTRLRRPRGCWRREQERTAGGGGRCRPRGGACGARWRGGWRGRQVAPSGSSAAPLSSGRSS